MFLRFSVWVSLRFIEKNYLVCLGGYFPQIGPFHDSSLKSVVYSLLSPFPSVLCIPISTIDFITIHPVPVASALLILGWSWATAAERTLSLPRSAEGYTAAAQFPYSLKPARMERRSKQGVGGGGGLQRSYPLCLKSDPICLPIFLHLHSPSFHVRLVLGYWWELRAHCLLLGTQLQLLRSWEADTRINSLSERLAEVSLSLAKISEKIGGSYVIGRAALALAKIYRLSKIHESWQPG